MDSSTVKCWMSICHFRGVRSILLILFCFCWKILSANNVDPDQMPHYVVFDLGLHCLHMTFYGFPGKNGLRHVIMTSYETPC